jgi:hypothetical protein
VKIDQWRTIPACANLLPRRIKGSQSCSHGIHFLLQSLLWTNGIFANYGMDSLSRQIIPSQIRVHYIHEDSAHTA